MIKKNNSYQSTGDWLFLCLFVFLYPYPWFYFVPVQFWHVYPHGILEVRHLQNRSLAQCRWLWDGSEIIFCRRKPGGLWLKYNDNCRGLVLKKDTWKHVALGNRFFWFGIFETTKKIQRIVESPPLGRCVFSWCRPRRQRGWAISPGTFSHRCSWKIVEPLWPWSTNHFVHSHWRYQKQFFP